MPIKADLHLHTREGEAFIAYDARALIDRAAREGFQVLSITNHDALTFTAELAAYARERGVLLIPGVEVTIQGKHVLLYNIDVPPARIRTFPDLRRLKRPEWLVGGFAAPARSDLAFLPGYHRMFCRRPAATATPVPPSANL